jgi:hypothetical protein
VQAGGFSGGRVRAADPGAFACLRYGTAINREAALGRAIDEHEYDPFQAPERVAQLERAPDAIRTDHRAIGVTGEVRLVKPGWPLVAQTSRRRQAVEGATGIFRPMPPTA